uniref:Transcription factor BTF3 n=1 Tax=Myotis lucifugus TaxID=59463 RepID=G1Q149_MYOLU
HESRKVTKPQAQVQIGGKGIARRKKKVTADDKKLQGSLKLAVNTIGCIEEVNMIKDDGTVIHFNNPKVQAFLSANTFAITSHRKAKPNTEMLPGTLCPGSHLGANSFTSLRKLDEQFLCKASKPEDTEEEEHVPDQKRTSSEITLNNIN